MKKFLISVIGMLLPSVSFAQTTTVEVPTVSMNPEAVASLTAASVGFLIGFLVVYLFFIIAIYVYFGICFMKMAEKTGTAKKWMAWVPILNYYLLVKIARKPSWWFILYFVPLVNIVIAVLVFMSICKQLNKPEWLGILTIIPVANIVLIGYLAFSKSGNQPVNPTQTSQVPPVSPSNDQANASA